MGIPFQPRDPGAYSWEPWPPGYDSPTLAAMAESNPSIASFVARETEPKLANNFLKGDNPGVVMTAAEVKFLLAEAWANQRRSDYPRLKSPAEYGFSQFLTDGTEIPVRLCYPVLESSYNSKNYKDALSRMGLTTEDSWNKPVWWDVN